MPHLLDDFENLLENILESNSFSWLPASTSLQETMQKILSVIMSEQEANPAGIIRGDFIIQVSQEDYPIWFANQVDLVHLSQDLLILCNKAGYHMDKPPAFHIMASNTQNKGNVEIEPVLATPDATETQYLGIKPDKSNLENRRPQPAIEINAYLTNNENKIFPLTKPVTNIGRREDNDIVLQDQRISRQHAQIRRAHQHFHIFDLNSTGGTLVNNQRVTQAVLASGDVISFAGVLMIYAEEITMLDEEQTNELDGTTSAPKTTPDQHTGEEVL